MIKEIIENFISDRKFKNNQIIGIPVYVMNDDVNKIYKSGVYEAITRAGPFFLRDIIPEVDKWCEKKKKRIMYSKDFNVEFGCATFHFSRHKEAEEFRKVFNLT